MLDNEIIDLYFERNEEAINATAEKYGSYCSRIAFNILADIHDSEECVNDTYMKAWNNIPPKRPTVLSAFLAKITRNIAIDRYKGDHADKRADRLATSIEELYDAIEDENTWNKLELVELGDLISKFLYTEKEAARRIFVLRYFYEYSIEDIAHIYATSASYVKTKLHRTRHALAKYLNDNGVAV
jgi:RNA polymerase sigma-70 factor (ECF subfamily)